MNERVRRRPNLAQYAPACTSNMCLGRERTRMPSSDSITVSPFHRTSRRRSAAVLSEGRFVRVCRVRGSVRWWRSVAGRGSGCPAHVRGRCGWTRVPSSDMTAASPVHRMGGRRGAVAFSGVRFGRGCRVRGSAWQSLATLQPGRAWIGGAGVVRGPGLQAMGCTADVRFRRYSSAERRCASGRPEVAITDGRCRGRVVG